MIDQPAIYYRPPAQATNHCLRLPHGAVAFAWAIRRRLP